MIASVRDVIARDLSDGPPRIGTVAEGLHLSERTLQRRLAEAGWTYLGLLDDVRRTVACERVAKTGASFKDVARDLGFAEQASFTRAFRRWTGLTPREFRRRAGTSAVEGRRDTEFEGQIQLGTAEFPDLTFVNEMLPKGADVTVQSGRGSVDGGFEIGGASECHGSVKIKTEDLVLAASGVRNDGDVEVVIEVPDGNMNELQLGLDHTRVEFKNFDFKSEGYEEKLPPWQARFELTEGDLDLRETMGLSGHLELSFTDTRPLVAFLSRDKPMKGWKKNLLMIETITGESVVDMTAGRATVRHFGIRGEKLDIRFRATIDSRGAYGKARAKYGILKAGIGLEGKDRDLKILRVGTWYKKNDLAGMPPLLPQYEEEVDVAQEEAEAAAAEAKAAEEEAEAGAGPH